MKTKLLIFLLFTTIIINAQTNLVPNGNFENWTSSSQPDNWFRHFSGFVSKSTSAQNGTSSTNMMIADGTFNFINSEYFPVVANKTYRITLYHKLVTGSFSAIDLSLYNKPGTFKAEITKKTDATFSSSEWRKIEFDYTPTVSENIEVDIWTTGTLNSEILVDNVSVIDVAEPIQVYTLIPDPKFEDKLIALQIDKDGKNGKVLTNSINKLTSLDVSSSSITDLTGIQDFVALKTLNCHFNQLTVLDVSKNVALTELRCYSNAIPSLDVSANLALNHLECDFNRLTTLDVTANLALRHLQCQSNNLTTLNLSKNVALETLLCHSNKLSVLDVAKNVALTRFNCYNNLLTSLDVSKNVALTTFNCSSNKLLSLNLKNGKNTLFTNNNLIFSENLNLKCIVVDDVAYSNTNWINKKNATAFFSPFDCSTVTQIPDAKFEDKLIALQIDKDGKNGLVATASIAALTTLDVSNSSITDLTGIQAFTALTTLNCSGNLLKKLDVSKNTAFSTLNCANNPSLICIQVANVAAASNWTTIKDATASFNLDCTIYTLIPDAKFEDKLIALQIDKDGKNGKVATESIATLTTLDVPFSSITDLTGIQDFKALTALYCYDNQLSNLDISKNVNLITIECKYNQLTSLDVSKNIALTYLSAYSNKLTNLDVTNNFALSTLYCSSNQLTSLDVSKNNKLTDLNCYNNSLITLDVSKNIILTRLDCSLNNLKSVNLKNGNNTKLNNSAFTRNPNLSCIQVDDAAYSITNWASLKDTAASYSTDCAYSTAIPDPKFEDKLIALQIDTDGKNGKVLTANIANLTSLNVSNAGISDLTGIEDFRLLQSLSCNQNNLTKIDVSKNLLLASLNVANNQLTTLNVAKNTKLETIYCNDNLFKTLDFSKNGSLTTIYCPNNKLIALNLKNGNNAVSNGPSIKNFTNNPDLSCIQVDNVVYSNTNWASYKDTAASYSSDCAYSTAIPDAKFEDKLIALGIDTGTKDGKVLTANIMYLTSLDVSESSITNLTGIQDFVSLTNINCSSNQLATLDVSKNTALTSLSCSYNKLTTLDISKNTALTSLGSGANPFTTLDVSKNTALKVLYHNEGKLTTLDLSKNIALTNLQCSGNNLNYLNLKNGKNTFLDKSIFFITRNPNLYCVLVDDVTYSNTNWTNKDAITTFNTECNGITLPSNNFTIQSKGETCTNENNGEISITAKATFSYVAIINGKNYPFVNNSLKVANLAPGTHTVSITITGQTFEQSFTITIPKAVAITGKMSSTANKISVEITQGTAPFTVSVDGIDQFETTESSFAIEAKKGGLLEVKTAKACEGIYAKNIARLDGAAAAYPNPTSGSFEVELPTSRKEVAIALYTLDGHLISTKTYAVENGKAKLTLENQPAGVYIIKIELDTPDYLKIIKN
jgi:hypothetical protein